MAFDARSAAIGAIIVIILLMVWKFLTSSRSFYSVLPDFQDSMTLQDANALYEATFKSITDEADANAQYARKVSPEKELIELKEGRNILNKLSEKYEEFIMKKQKSMPQQEIIMVASPSPST